jgi:hypothetical protein
MWRKMNSRTGKRYIKEVKVVTDGVARVYCNAATVIKEFWRSWALQYTEVPMPLMETPWFGREGVNQHASLAANQLTLPVSEEEFTQALSCLNDMAPGTDGIDANIL